MGTTMEQVRSKCGLASFIGALTLAYVCALVQHWRGLGLLGFILSVLYKPVSLIVDVEIRYLCLITGLCVMYLFLVRKYVHGGVSALSLIFKVSLLALLYVVAENVFVCSIYPTTGIRLKVYVDLVNVVWVTGVIVYESRVQRNYEIAKEAFGLFGYLIRSYTVLGYLGIPTLSVLVGWVSHLFGCGALAVLESVWEGAVNGLVLYGAFSSILHLYIYNIKYFTSEPGMDLGGSDLVCDCIFTGLCVSSYIDGEYSPSKSTKEANIDAIYHYIVEVLQSMEYLVYTIVRNQMVQKVSVPQKKVRNIPDILLTTRATTEVSLYSDFSSKVTHKPIFTLLSRIVYQRALFKAKHVDRIIKKLKTVSWKLEAGKKKKLVLAVERVKKEAEKIVPIKTVELTNLLSIWICTISS
ncbi:hypothetical protein NEDG_01099 [Nematocida displodere]|uniref:Uncharacterized protein n=1 Tax=Nematocida displodere TaxID=1805483 RepID=A0A177EC46_9MICR|nr:hypothetical protein NEDG_01099 [Nematocida displodere]